MRVIYGTELFNHNVYESSPVDFQISEDGYWLKADSSYVQKYVFSENRVESDDRYMSLGFKPQDYTFFSAKHESTENFPDQYGIKNIFSFTFSMNMDVITHNRSIYTLWDFFADVGGLFDMLKLLSHFLLSLISSIMGSGLDQFLL